MTDVLPDAIPLGRRRQVALTIGARLSGVSNAQARNIDAWLHAREAGTEPPIEFQGGSTARCLAVLQIEQARPLLFWGGLISIAAIPLMLAHKFWGG